MWVYAEAHEVRVDGAWLGTVPLCVWPPEEDVFVAEAEVDYEIAVCVFVCVCGVSWERVFVVEPLLG
jgi:hypothetical protein